MMHASDSDIGRQLAVLGNTPGDHQGDCLLRLPGNGGQHVVASASLTLFTEGIVGTLPDGRRFFAHSSGLVVIDLKADGSANGPESGLADQEPQQ